MQGGALGAPRRLVAAVALGAALLLASLPTRPAAQAQNEPPPAYAGPLVDTHAHLEAATPVSPDLLMALYDTVGVRGAWTFGVPWSTATSAWERFPDRVVPFLAEGYA